MRVERPAGKALGCGLLGPAPSEFQPPWCWLMGANRQEEGCSHGWPLAPSTLIKPSAPSYAGSLDNGHVGPRKARARVSLATCSLATGLSRTSLGKTMPLCRLSLLFLAWVSASWAQLKRQRVGELEQAPGVMQGSAGSLGSGVQEGGGCTDPFLLLPWALVLAFSGSFVMYLLFAREQGVSGSASSLPTTREAPSPFPCTPASCARQPTSTSDQQHVVWARNPVPRLMIYCLEKGVLLFAFA